MILKSLQICFILVFICFGNLGLAIVASSSPSKQINPIVKKQEIKKYRSNKKLSFKERLILKLFKKKRKNKNSQKKEKEKYDGMALSGFILGLAGILIPGLGILGLIFSLKGLKRFKTKSYNKRGEKLAKIGIALGIIGIIISTYFLVLALLFIG
jgi:uncharacterized protein DUF4190